MITLFISVSLWVFFGVVAYGLAKELFRKDCSILSSKYNTGRIYGKNEELICCIIGCFGFIGFLVECFIIRKAVLSSEYFIKNLTQEEINKKFCFMMPKKFKIS